MQEYKGLDFINGKFLRYLYLSIDLQKKSCSKIKKLPSEMFFFQIKKILI